MKLKRIYSGTKKNSLTNLNFTKIPSAATFFFAVKTETVKTL